LDLSDYIIDANGFIPIPMIITEPALGGFGVALIPVFIRKNAPYLDSVRGQLVKTAVAPDITGGYWFIHGEWYLGRTCAPVRRSCQKQDKVYHRWGLR
jgi:hypothetical protein